MGALASATGWRRRGQCRKSPGGRSVQPGFATGPAPGPGAWGLPARPARPRRWLPALFCRRPGRNEKGIAARSRRRDRSGSRQIAVALPAARRAQPGNTVAEHSLDPDINRERVEMLVAEEQHAVGDLGADPAQPGQGSQGGGAVQRPPRLQPGIPPLIPCGEPLGRHQQADRAETQPAGPQFRFLQSCNPLDRRIGEQVRRPGIARRLTEPPAQRVGNLRDVRHLLEGRGDERRQTFPEWLPDDPQAAAGGERGLHRRIAGQGRVDFLQRMIQREITLDRRGAAWRGPQRLAALLDVDRRGTNYPRVPTPQPPPMENLPQFRVSPRLNSPGRGMASSVGKVVVSGERPPFGPCPDFGRQRMK